MVSGALVIVAEIVGQARIGIGHDQACPRFADSAAMWARSWAAPNEQLRPIDSGRAWRTEAQKLSIEWPERLRPERSVIVIDSMIGRSGVDAAGGMDRGLGVQRVEHGLDQHEVDAALEQRLDLLDIDVRHVSKSISRKPGSLTSGDSDRVLLVGPIAPATKRFLPSASRPPRGRSAPRRALMSLHQMLGAIIGLADPVGVEGVGGEDVGAGVGEALRDLARPVRPGQVQEVVIALLVAARDRARRDNRLRRACAPGSGSRRRRP